MRSAEPSPLLPAAARRPAPAAPPGAPRPPRPRAGRPRRAGRGVPGRPFPALSLNRAERPITPEAVALAAPAGAPWPGAGQGTGMFLPVAEAGVRADPPGTASGDSTLPGVPRGQAAAVPPGLAGALPRHPLAGAGRLPPGGRLPLGHRPRVRAALVAAGGHRPDRVRPGRRGPGHQRRYDAGRDPRTAAGRLHGRDGGHPRHRRRGAGPRPGVRPGRWPDAVPAGHLALVRRRRQRGRSLRPVQHLRRRARRRPLPVRLRRRPAHTLRAWPRRC